MSRDDSRPPLRWSTQLNVLPEAATPALKGDKIILPPSALEQLLSAATVTITTDVRPQTSSFDPYNPHSFAAERQAREQLIERRQHLPHPLTFRLVNPGNGRNLYAGVREFSAEDGAVGLSPFLREALGINKSISKRIGARSKHDMISKTDLHEADALPKLTIHVEELPKGSFVKLRPLEAGYDSEDWKALLEHYLRDTFTTLTNGEEIAVPAGKEIFRFLVDGLRPKDEAVSLVDTDLEVDIEPLSEEQARETLRKQAQKFQRVPGTKEGSSAGGKLDIGINETGQVRASEYVDYSVESWDKKTDLVFELTSWNDDEDIDLFITTFTPRHRSKPREEEYMFGEISSRTAKKVKICHTNAEMDNAEAIWVSVRGYAKCDESTLEQAVPTQYSLQISAIEPSLPACDDVHISDEGVLSPDEERCANCRQPVPKSTMFLHQNFCVRNNVLCPLCDIVFQKTSEAWKNHWHCPHDDGYGNTFASKSKHDKLVHASRLCPSCGHEASNTPDLAHHRTTTCPDKLILCQFCHLQVPQQGTDDQSPDSAEVMLSGLTPHELSDGARTTECHLCSNIVRLRDMSTHLKYHDLQRLSRLKPRICRNVNCGRIIDSVSKPGEVRHQTPKNDLGLCDTCFGPLYVSQYDPNGQGLRRRVERKYLTQLLSGCNQPWCRNKYCKAGRKHVGILEEGKTITSKDAMSMIRRSLDNLKDLKMPLHLCTGEASQKRRTLAEMVAVEGDGVRKMKGKEREGEGMGDGYQLEWCIAALEVEDGDLDKARGWLKDFAPTRAETGK